MIVDWAKDKPKPFLESSQLEIFKNPKLLTLKPTTFITFFGRAIPRCPLMLPQNLYRTDFLTKKRDFIVF